MKSLVLQFIFNTIQYKRMKAYFRNNLQSEMLVFQPSLIWNYSLLKNCHSFLTSHCGTSHDDSYDTNKYSPSVSTQQSPNGTSTVAETKSHLKKKNCSHGKVPILMKYFLQESKNQTYHSKVWPNVCSSRGRRVVERKQASVGLGEKKSYQ